MKKLTALTVLVFVGLSFSVSSALAMGNCADKADKPIKKITQSDGAAPKSG